MVENNHPCWYELSDRGLMLSRRKQRRMGEELLSHWALHRCALPSPFVLDPAFWSNLLCCWCSGDMYGWMTIMKEVLTFKFEKLRKGKGITHGKGLKSKQNWIRVPHHHLATLLPGCFSHWYCLSIKWYTECMGPVSTDPYSTWEVQWVLWIKYNFTLKA